MGIIGKAHLIIYRIRQKGLEVFLVNQDLQNEANWELPAGEIDEATTQFIELDPIAGTEKKAVAVEGDWHDIPSLKSLIKQDVLMVTDKVLGELEKNGTFFVVKEAFKKVLPAQYEFLKELREIINEKNAVKDL